MSATLTVAVRLNNRTGLSKCSNFGLIFKSHCMNKIILAISLASIMMGCSTVYKTGQTIEPDQLPNMSMWKKKMNTGLQKFP